MRIALLCMLLVSASVSAQILSQTLPVGYDNVQGGSGSGFPFNSAPDHIWQWHYANSNFAGLTGPITIVDVSVRALSATATVAAFNFPSVEVVLGTAITGYQLGQHDPVFSNNLCSDATVVRTGPWVAGPFPPTGGATAPWISFANGGAFTPFVFDPTSGRDFIVQIRKCGNVALWATSIDGRTGTGAGSVGGNRYGVTNSCSATSFSFNNNEYVPVVKIDYIVGGTPGICVAPFQTNSPGATMTVNGALGTGATTAITTTVPTIPAAQLALASTAQGFPWDIALTSPTRAVPFGGGGLLTPNGQVLNIDILDPSFTTLFNVGASSPPFFSTTLPLSVPFSLDIAGQLFVVNPASADGFSLSHANNVEFRLCDADEDFESVVLGQTSPIGWNNGAGGAARWTIQTGGTPSAGTGPTSAFQGTRYAYCETSVTANTLFRMDTCGVDISTLSAFTLNFALSRIGATTGTLSVYMDDGSGTFATLLASYTGSNPAQAQGGVEWSLESLPFTPTAQFMSFRFEYIAGSSFTGDLAIDAVDVN